MTRRTVQELVNQANASLPDNTAEAISPADVRNMVIDFLDTITPMYGGLAVSSRAFNVTTTPQPVTFDSVLSSFPPEWEVNAAAGTISRKLNAVAAMTSKIWITGVFEGPQGNELTLQLEKNGQLLNRKTEETSEGPTKSVGFALNMLDYGSTDAVYRLMISTPSGSASFTLKDVQMIGENVPVRDVPAVGKIG